MMSFQIDFWHIICFIAMLISAFWGLITIIVKQFNNGLEKRFSMNDEARAQLEKVRKTETAAADARIEKLETSQRSQEREFLNLKAELPDKYVRREDAIRSETLVNAKLDGLALRLDTVLRNQKNE